MMNLRENKRYFGDFSAGRAATAARSNEIAAPATVDQAGSNKSVPPSAAEKLPSLATSNDVREIVRVLKSESTGLSLLEVLKLEPRRIFEARKLAAYEYWGIIRREENAIKLTRLGQSMAETIAAESRAFAQVLSGIPPYLSAIEWTQRQNLKILTHEDVAEFWNRSAGEAAARHDALNREAEAVSFFSICHAAELGVATVGKRGQPARLRIEPEKLEEFLSEIKNEARDDARPPAGERLPKTAGGGNGNRREDAGTIRRVYVSGAEGAGVLEHLSGALDLADFEGVASENFFESDFPRSANLELLRSCQAAVFVIESEDCAADSGGRTRIGGERLTEIVAALALFDGRVIFVWKSPLAPPDELRRYGSHLVAGGDEIRASFRTVRLLKAMKSSDEIGQARF